MKLPTWFSRLRASWLELPLVWRCWCTFTVLTFLAGVACTAFEIVLR